MPAIYLATLYGYSESLAAFHKECFMHALKIVGFFFGILAFCNKYCQIIQSSKLRHLNASVMLVKFRRDQKYSKTLQNFRKKTLTEIGQLMVKI